MLDTDAVARSGPSRLLQCHPPDLRAVWAVNIRELRSTLRIRVNSPSKVNDHICVRLRATHQHIPRSWLLKWFRMIRN